MRLFPYTLLLAVVVSSVPFFASGCAAGAETVVVKSDGGSSDGGAFPFPNGSDPSDPSDPAPAASPIEIKNLSFSASGNQAEITFVLKNNSTETIDRVREVVVSLGSPVTFLSTCTSLTLQVGPGKSSSVITLSLYDSGATTPTLSVPCGTADGDATTKPWGSTLSLELKGLLKDATPWKAKATATN